VTVYRSSSRLGGTTYPGKRGINSRIALDAHTLWACIHHSDTFDAISAVGASATATLSLLVGRMPRPPRYQATPPH